MEQLDAARDELLDDDDQLVGRVKDVKEVEKRLRHRLLPRNAWRLVPFFELFMSAPKDELHQWYVLSPHMYILVCTFMYKYILIYTCSLQVSGPVRGSHCASRASSLHSGPAAG